MVAVGDGPVFGRDGVWLTWPVLRMRVQCKASATTPPGAAPLPSHIPGPPRPHPSPPVGREPQRISWLLSTVVGRSALVSASASKVASRTSAR